MSLNPLLLSGSISWGPMRVRRFRPNTWNGLRVDSGRALVVNGTRLYSTKGIGNGTGIPASNPTGGYQALQGVYFPTNQSSWEPPYTAYSGNPVRAMGCVPEGGLRGTLILLLSFFASRGQIQGGAFITFPPPLSHPSPPPPPSPVTLYSLHLDHAGRPTWKYVHCRRGRKLRVFQRPR